jgi:hypothetical protein
MGEELNNPVAYQLDFALTADLDSEVNPNTLPIDVFCANYYYRKKQLFGRARITKI